MKEYTSKQIKELKANPYTLNVTKNKSLLLNLSLTRGTL